MSLRFDLDKVKNFNAVCKNEDGTMKPQTQALIWATMAVGIGEITDKNAEEFYKRLELWEKVNGTYITDADGNKKPLTLDDVKAHVGLHTNVFPKETHKKFMLKLGDLALEKLTGKRFLLLR